MSGTRTNWHVLIIDDDLYAAEGIRTTLENFGLLVTVCGNGEEALRRSEKERFDFIITDHDMPGMKGLEVARKMRERFPRASIIGMSRSDRCDAFLFAGANWFIHKPVTLSKLQQVFGHLRRDERS
jgi:CheY-like chemotaxis protein